MYLYGLSGHDPSALNSALQNIDDAIGLMSTATSQMRTGQTVGFRGLYDRVRYPVSNAIGELAQAPRTRETQYAMDILRQVQTALTTVQAAGFSGLGSFPAPIAPMWMMGGSRGPGPFMQGAPQGVSLPGPTPFTKPQMARRTVGPIASRITSMLQAARRAVATQIRG